MADKILKSITFPDLADRYVIPTDAEDFTYEGENLKEVLDNKANIDGYYQNMSVGDADQLTSTIRENDKTPYVFRTSGGSVDIGDREYVNGIVGGTVAWNQLISTATAKNTSTTDTRAYVALRIVSGSSYVSVATVSTAGVVEKILAPSFTGNSSLKHSGSSVDLVFATNIPITSGHKYFIHVNFVGANPTVLNGVETKEQMLIDLTQMFGSTIADYIYSLEQANAGAGVAWFKKLFPNLDAEYTWVDQSEVSHTQKLRDYQTGILLSVGGLVSHDMTGFNQWDEEWEVGGYNTTTGEKSTDNSRIRTKNLLRCLPNTTYYLNSPATVIFLYYDGDKNYIDYFDYSSGATFTTPSNAHYMNFYVATSYGTTYKNDICINISWDGSRNGEYEPYVKHSYPLDSSLTLRGIPKLDANNALYYDGDVYEPDGTVTRKYGIVDLGTLNWSYSSVNGMFNTQAITNFTTKVADDVAIAKAYANSGNVSWANQPDKTYQTYQGKLWIKDSAYSDADTFKSAMDGVYCVFPFATPTEETADPYTQVQIVDDFGTEEYVFSNSAFPIPVGHDTDYPVNLKAKLEMAPDSPSGDGDYIVRQTNGTNAYVPLVIEDALPTIPSTAGSYELVVTVADGSDPVLSWKSEV